MHFGIELLSESLFKLIKQLVVSFHWLPSFVIFPDYGHSELTLYHQKK